MESLLEVLAAQIANILDGQRNAIAFPRTR
jgi:hypothetical protein